MVKMESVLLASKFRGCLMGALLGDCLGSPYEMDCTVSKLQLQQYFDKMNKTQFKGLVKQYTDDTAMTKCVANSLIARQGLDPHDLARRFTVEYFNEPRRGYGENVIDVFYKLRAQRFQNPFGPAKEQFNGHGSYGNGGAMRVAPVALYYHENLQDVIDKAKLSAEITHTHERGVQGAILQAIAVHQALEANPSEEFDTTVFTQKLRTEMSKVEVDVEGLGMMAPLPYREQLTMLEYLLAAEKHNQLHEDDVLKHLGSSVAALYSVPTAIYCFLRAVSSMNIPNIKTDNPFQRTVQYAISLGGDTDTIGSMAGALAGAYYGEGMISKALLQHCEAADKMTDLACALYSVTLE